MVKLNKRFESFMTQASTEDTRLSLAKYLHVKYEGDSTDM